MRFIGVAAAIISPLSYITCAVKINFKRNQRKYRYIKIQTMKINECTQRLTQLILLFLYVTPSMSHKTLISFFKFRPNNRFACCCGSECRRYSLLPTTKIIAVYCVSNKGSEKSRNTLTTKLFSRLCACVRSLFSHCLYIFVFSRFQITTTIHVHACVCIVAAVMCTYILYVPLMMYFVVIVCTTMR